MIAEAFADGVPPEVAGDVLYLIGGPKMHSIPRERGGGIGEIGTLCVV
jgi:hypothetical protein